MPFNAIVRLFGGSDEAHTLVYRFGNEPTYYDWMAQKLVWTGDGAYVRQLKDKIVGFPQTALPCNAVLTRADGSTETLRLQPENGCVTLRLESDIVSLVIQP